MNVLLTGGSACAKSTYAEALCERLPGPRFYIAAMRPIDHECLLRIARHQKQREHKGFVTIEKYCDLSSLTLPQRGTALLECLCNLTANEMFSPEGAGKSTVDAILDGIDHLAAQCENLILVTNEIGADGVCYHDETLCYIKTLGAINRALVKRCDRVAELVCGIPLFLKGEPL